MFSQIDDSSARLKGKFFRIELPPKGALGDSKEQYPIFAGWGACKSCGCPGYIKSGDGSTCKNCSHHFNQHR
jgi:hypothetical protein